MSAFECRVEREVFEGVDAHCFVRGGGREEGEGVGVWD